MAHSEGTRTANFIMKSFFVPSNSLVWTNFFLHFRLIHGFVDIGAMLLLLVALDFPNILKWLMEDIVLGGHVS